MKTSEIRERFLQFFEDNGHQRVASSSLVPQNDPTLLFVNSGMVQFKDVFLGADKRPYRRATTAQRCVRAGGKHNDLENVGYTARHHTFFEMLGNFSFGEYFKQQAIQFAWQFLTEEVGLPRERLWVTVFEDDDEAADIWLKEIGIEPQKFARIGAHDNFWSMGDTGPCGPCSEIFYDHGAEVEGGPPGTPEQDGDRYVEIWNLVFMQFNRDADGRQTLLPKPSVDTGLGLERLAAVLQGVHSNYDIDLFRNLVRAAQEVTGATDASDQSLRVLADHIRSTAFLIVDGVVPGNEGRGYVLRRIIRRAIRHGYRIGGETPFFHRLVQPLVTEMGAAYPELVAARDRVVEVLQREEARFAETLEQGMKIFDQEVAAVSGQTIPGDVAFRLYDTFGFPVDLTADVARERGLQIDMAGFEHAMEGQRQKGRAASRFNVDLSLPAEVQSMATTAFSGYDGTEQHARLTAILCAGELKTELDAEQDAILILDQTPFYAESGGQVGDQGEIRGTDAVFTVHDTQKIGTGVVAHFGRLTTGRLTLEQEVDAAVQPVVRAATMRNHSATHLLHAALRQVLGDHVEQKGSLVEADRLRFDYSHPQPMAAAEMRTIDDIVNGEIRNNHQVTTRLMALENAKAAGAAALFGEKYDDAVRVVAMGEFSLELCGGTHVQRTGDIGLFNITSETGIAAGIRRLEAVTGQGAVDYLHQQLEQIDRTATLLRGGRAEVNDKVGQLLERVKQLEKEKKQLQTQLASGGGNDLTAAATEIAGVKVLATRIDNTEGKVLRDTIDKLRDRLGDAVVVLGSVHDGKGKLVAGVSRSISKRVHAGELVKHLAALGGGRGGGRADMAEAGIGDIDKIDQLLQEVEPWVGARLNAE